MDTAHTFEINGESKTVNTDPERPLLDVIREDLGLTGCKYGCGEGKCRSCTVLMDGRPITACTTPVRKAAGKKIITIEGLEKNGALHVVQEAFMVEGAMQCGFCVPGMIMTAVVLLEQKPEPTDAEIDEWMNGNICRCCGYPNIVKAIHLAAGRAAAEAVS